MPWHGITIGVLAVTATGLAALVLLLGIVVLAYHLQHEEDSLDAYNDSNDDSGWPDAA